MNSMDNSNNSNSIPQYLINHDYYTNQCTYSLALLAMGGKDISSILNKQGINRVAIYGMGRMGQLLSELLTNSTICVSCCLDVNGFVSDPYHKIFHSISDLSGNVDAIIITSDIYYSEIYETIRSVDKRTMIIRASELIEELSILPNEY